MTNVGLRSCAVCGARVRRFKDQGYPYPVLFQKQVVGGIPKLQDECPVCRSNSRTRLVYLYLHHLAELSPTARVLHVAPERALQLYFGRRRLGRYVVGDLHPERYLNIGEMTELDVTDLRFDDGTFDLIVCNHVLEHVPDDAAAMAELRRVLDPGGLCIVQTPFSLNCLATDESDQALDDATRISRFGQIDHVRIYAKADYLARLARAGFHVEEFWAWRSVPDLAARYRVDPLEPLFLCRPAS
jgi:SAM-dependent methyltransferase